MTVSFAHHRARWALAFAAAFLSIFLSSSRLIAQPVLITADITVGPADSTIASTDGGPAVPLATAQITVSNAATLTISGRHRIASLTLSGLSRLKHSPAITVEYSDGPINGLELTVDQDVVIDTSCGIDLTGLGFPPGQGPGAGQDAIGQYRGGGGGYGGAGGRYSSNPATPMFDGGPTYGSFREPVDFGSPGGSSFDGTLPGGPGGGCLRLIVGGHVNVAGFITCDGRFAPNGASGSGGTLRISAQLVAGGGGLSASGGQSFVSGGGGRIAIQAPQLTMNISRISARGPSSSGGDAGTVYIEAGSNRPLLRISGSSYAGAITQTPRPFAIDLPNGRIEVDNARIVGTSINLRCAELFIGVNGAIDASGLGHGPDQGPGRGNGIGQIGGAGYGGAGGARVIVRVLGGQTYGNFAEPTDLGSGGASASGAIGGAGGGAIRLEVTESIQLLGELRSNAGLPWGIAGGGSGGSIWVSTTTLSGTGFARARGNSQGGGGRIAIHATACSIPTTNFDTYSSFAGPGTVYFAIGSERPKLIFDNLQTSPQTSGVAASPLDINLPGGDVVFSRCAIVAPSITVHAENIRIDGAHLFTSGFGYEAGQGPGRGLDGEGNALGGGGGHGGRGGPGQVLNRDLGGPTYGSAIQPMEPGSGGDLQANAQPRDNPSGGGAVRLIANSFQHFGRIFCDGGHGGPVGAGAAGGSVWITANTIEGTGFISANGSTARSSSGGGGRIAIYSCSGALPPANVTVTGPASAEDGSLAIAPLAVQLSPFTDPCFRATLILNATAAGIGQLTYQWQREGLLLEDGDQPSGATIAGAQSTSLTIHNFTPADVASYQLVVTSACGSVTTPPAQPSLCLADTDCDGDTDAADTTAFFTQWDAANPTADLDTDGDTDSDDIITFFSAWNSGC